MNAILGFSELYSRNPDGPRRRIVTTSMRFRPADTLLTLINDILDLSKIEAGKLGCNTSRSACRGWWTKSKALLIRAEEKGSGWCRSRPEAAARGLMLG